MRLAVLFTMATELGAGRHGILTAAGLRLAGADPDTVQQALRRHWQAPVRGVYLPHRRPLSDAEIAHVAVAHAGPDTIVSGYVAARALGMRWLPDDVQGAVALIPAESRRVSSEGLVLVRRCAALPTMSTRPWEGVRLADPAQVVVDTCRQLLATRRASTDKRPSQAGGFERWCLRDVRGVVLGAIADRLCTVAEMQQVVEAGAMRDSALLRRACVDASRGAASPPEAELVDHLLDYGVLFAMNVELWDDDALVAVLDVHLIGTGVGGEMDSKEAHERPDLLDATLLRHDRVASYGMELRHITPSRYRAAPDRFHEALFAAARTQLAKGLGDPPELRLVARGPVLRGSRRQPPYRLPAVGGRRAA